ncbi:MAG: AAA family ATPase [Deltaproteobacteria bacterium]|jgi:DNA polymerase III gamma/tau subunit|nr:AAA family ATPase [Deltaproteobacteria bacterium]
MSYLDEIIAHHFPKQQITARLQNSTLHHALLFTGASGIGKRSLALKLAQDILLEDEPQIETTTKLINYGNHPDLLYVELEKNDKTDKYKQEISIEQIRKLISTLQLKPFKAKKIVAIIDNAHLMSISANNALLKTLEEPLPSVQLILITDRPQRLLETIVSRCQVYNFEPLTQTDILQILDRLLSQLNLTDTSFIQKILASVATNSLELLGLKEFINTRTNKIINLKGLQEHLQALASEIVELESDLNKLISNSGSGELPNHNTAVSLATKISEKKDSHYINIFWFLLKNKLRQAMWTHGSSKFTDLLEKTIQAEQLIQERNASFQLQLSSLFLELVA